MQKREERIVGMMMLMREVVGMDAQAKGLVSGGRYFFHNKRRQEKVHREVCRWGEELI